MRSVNKVILIGHLAADPEIRETKAGPKVGSFPLATNRDWVTNGSKKASTDYHKIVAWGKLVDVIEKYLTKGMAVYIEGRLQNRSFETSDGSKRFVTEVHLENLNMLSWDKKNGVEQMNLEDPAKSPMSNK